MEHRHVLLRAASYKRPASPGSWTVRVPPRFGVSSPALATAWSMARRRLLRARPPAKLIACRCLPGRWGAYWPTNRRIRRQSRHCILALRCTARNGPTRRRCGFPLNIGCLVGCGVITGAEAGAEHRESAGWCYSRGVRLRRDRAFRGEWRGDRGGRIVSSRPT